MKSSVISFDPGVSEMLKVHFVVLIALIEPGSSVVAHKRPDHLPSFVSQNPSSEVLAFGQENLLIEIVTLGEYLPFALAMQATATAY